ncbi:MAG: HD domain-containing protein [Nitrospira sp.]|nr:MAG: HD domain-containing protein [Nitrospira sp.]
MWRGRSRCPWDSMVALRMKGTRSPMNIEKDSSTTSPGSTVTLNHTWESLSGYLGGDQPHTKIAQLRATGALHALLPEVDALFGIPQTPEYHPEIDTGIHTMLTLKRAAELTEDIAVRYAALVHDVGKSLTPPDHWPAHHQHEEFGVAPIRAIRQRLGVPEHISALAEHVARYHLHAHRSLELRPGTLLKVLEHTNALETPSVFEQFILAAQADAQGRQGLEDRPYPQARLLRLALQAAHAVATHDANGQELTAALIRQRRVEAIQRVHDDVRMSMERDRAICS